MTSYLFFEVRKVWEFGRDEPSPTVKAQACPKTNIKKNILNVEPTRDGDQPREETITRGCLVGLFHRQNLSTGCLPPTYLPSDYRRTSLPSDYRTVLSVLISVITFGYDGQDQSCLRNSRRFDIEGHALYA